MIIYVAFLVNEVYSIQRRLKLTWIFEVPWFYTFLMDEVGKVAYLPLERDWFMTKEKIKGRGKLLSDF